MEDGYPVAHGEGRNSLPHSGDRAHRFMAEDARGGVRSGVDLLQVGAADAAAVHPDEHLARTNRGHRNGLDADIVHAAINSGLHGRR